MKPESAVIKGLAFSCLLPLISIGAEFDLKAQLSADTFRMGDPIPITVEIRNNSRAQQPFDESDVSLHLIRRDTDQQVQLTGSMSPPASYTIPPNGSVRLEWDVNKLFASIVSGSYEISAVLEISVTEVTTQNGITSVIPKRVFTGTSPAARFSVLPLDEALINGISLLLNSSKIEDVQSAIDILRTSGTGAYRRELRALWSLVKSRSQPLRNQVLILIFSRIELAEGLISDEELFAEMARASTNSDECVRRSIAESLSALHGLGLRRQSLNRFTMEVVPKWFDGEKSGSCRALLISRLPIPQIELLAQVIETDPAPQVRAAAMERFAGLDPRGFLNLVDSFTNLAGEIVVKDQKLSLREFVDHEKARVRQVLGIR